MLQVIGFATKHLGLAPTIVYIKDPIVVAGVCGFWRDRGLAPMTIKIRVQHIVQATSFVDSGYCPGAQGTTMSNQTKKWFANLSAKALAEAGRQPKKLYNVALWEAWEFATSDYLAFLAAFKVRRGKRVGCEWYIGAISGSPPPPPHRPTTTCGPRSWPSGASPLC